MKNNYIMIGLSVLIILMGIVTYMNIVILSSVGKTYKLADSQEKVIKQQSELINSIDWEDYEDYKKKEIIKETLSEIVSNGIVDNTVIGQ